jgi:ABC-type transporter Mla MlaB component
MKQIKLAPNIVISEITQILKHLKYQLSTNEHCNIDLSEVKSIDSAGIAFLVYLKTKYPNIEFLYATIQIQNLCQLYKIQL